MSDFHVPGSEGEHALQERYDTARRAAAFYDNQMLDRLNDQMVEFIGRMEMMFIATSDAGGECDTSFRAGQAGFVRVLDEKTIIYPEYRGNGVMASLGNISENGHIGILFVDFFQGTVGLHVNGKAKIVEQHVIEPMRPLLERLAGVASLHDPNAGNKTTPERWVMVEIEEAYIHCSKHIPLLQKLDKDLAWGTDDEVRKGGDYFAAKRLERPWSVRAQLKAAAAASEELDQTAAQLAEAQALASAPAEEHVSDEPETEAPPAETQDQPVAQPAPEPPSETVEVLACDTVAEERSPATEVPPGEQPVVADVAQSPLATLGRRASTSSRLPFRMLRG
jgi:predicted pyridoxine 5'-phosphate oxidase superfamily flavin-nucleotide-binding protein